MNSLSPLHIALADGRYGRAEALDLLTRHVHASIAYLERSIEVHASEEDLKHVERKIARLQQEFFEIKQLILAGGDGFRLQVQLSAAPA